MFPAAYAHRLTRNSSVVIQNFLRKQSLSHACSSNVNYEIVLPAGTLRVRLQTPIICIVSRHFSTEPPHDFNSTYGQPMKFLKFDDLSDEEQRRFEILQYELEVLRQGAGRVPTEISERHWREILKMGGKHQRIKYYSYIFKTEMAETAEKRKKDELRVIRNARHEQLEKEIQEDPDRIRYGLNFNTMFPYVRDSTILEVQNVKLSRARLLSQPLIFDCDYEDWMSERERVNTATQLKDAHHCNKEARDPFWYQFCNLRRDGSIRRALQGAIPNLGTATCMIELSEKSYLDLFPREKLVYLTYNAEQTLTKFNHDDIYIIGALVDKTNPKPLSMAKSKRENLRMAKLPIDVFLRWTVGGKNLTVNQVAGIMCEVKDHGDWEKAFQKHIPKRKYLHAGDINSESGEEPYHKELLRRAPGSRRPVRERGQSVLSSLLYSQ